MKLIRRHSPSYNFAANPATGETFRWGRGVDEDPTCAPWPELADISISNYCTKGCSYCYRSSDEHGAFMSLKDYEHILTQLTHKKWGNVFQVALGGGEPLEHPNLISILNITRAHNVIPNLTTNGEKITIEICNALKDIIGAVAISVEDLATAPWHKVDLLIQAGVRTNIHFILRKSTLRQAIDILRGDYDDRLRGLNAVVFLTYKPAGRAACNDLLDKGDVQNLLTALTPIKSNVRMGFDACAVPLLLHSTGTDSRLVDSCESGFFSVYIDEKLNVTPCSFANDPKHKWNLREYCFENIWNDKLADYRMKFTNACKRKCSAKSDCRGACPYFPETTYCFNKNTCEPLKC